MSPDSLRSRRRQGAGPLARLTSLALDCDSTAGVIQLSEAWTSQRQHRHFCKLNAISLERREESFCRKTRWRRNLKMKLHVRAEDAFLWATALLVLLF